MLSPRSRTLAGLGLAMIAAAATFAVIAAPVTAANRVAWIKGSKAPGTPKRYDRVGVLKIGPKHAKNILIFNPGTSASSAYIAPFARTLVKKARGWQVWSVERRENLLEDQSVAEKAKEGKATAKQLFDYYLGWINDPSISPHFQFIPDSRVEFAKKWGMRVEINDLRKVVKAAQKHARHVVMMGHSLGGSITTAYATWDFNGQPGAKGLSGLVYDDGGSSPTPVSRGEAEQSLAELKTSSPWITLGGIPAPFTGLLAEGGAIQALIDPNAPSIAQSSGLLPAFLVPPFPVTNLAQWGYAADTETSPPSLSLFHAHLGHLARSGNPRGWRQAGEITPIKRYAKMFAGWGLKNVDGVAWYHPIRLSIDSGAVAEGNRNPAQRVLGVKAIHGDDLPQRMRIYAFGAAGGRAVLDSARTLARQSKLPRRRLTLVNRHRTYAHNDPAGAFPKNAFLSHLVPFLRRIGGR
jgi:pimeloyl-ACP methyl ester carboxylesterase